jgi:glyoxylase-like metal-dependent hydrolase (beta-lactamase superfamily II)
MPASRLEYAVYVTEGIPTTVTDLPPDLDKRMWSPTSAVLITGEQDAVLVDPLFTQSQAEALREWVTASGKNLTAVYITHGHPDHWLGLGTILEAFPSALAFAVPSVIDQMSAQSSPEVLAGQWQSRFTEPLAATAATAVIADPVPQRGHPPPDLRDQAKVVHAFQRHRLRRAEEPNISVQASPYRPLDGNPCKRTMIVSCRRYTI